MTTLTEVPKRPAIYCSFCGKSNDEVSQMVAGPDVYICSPCVTLCDDIVAYHWYKKLPEPTEDW